MAWKDLREAKEKARKNIKSKFPTRDMGKQDYEMGPSGKLRKVFQQQAQPSDVEPLPEYMYPKLIQKPTDVTGTYRSIVEPQPQYPSLEESRAKAPQVKTTVEAKPMTEPAPVILEEEEELRNTKMLEETAKSLAKEEAFKAKEEGREPKAPKSLWEELLVAFAPAALGAPAAGMKAHQMYLKEFKDQEKQDLEYAKLKAKQLKLKKEDKFKVAEKIGKWHSGLKTTKDTQTIVPAYYKVKNVAESEPSAAGDLALVFNFMKIQDPGSVVRESEFATATNAAGVDDRIRNIWNRLLEGERLVPEQRADFLRRAQDSYRAQMMAQKRIDKQFINMARRQGIEEPESVIISFGEMVEPGEIKVPRTEKKEEAPAKPGMIQKGWQKTKEASDFLQDQKRKSMLNYLRGNK